MNTKVILFLGLSLLILAASSASVPDAATTAKLLDLHNAERSQIGLKSLTWSSSLASSAQKWANNLAANGGLKHSKTKGVGENLAKASFRKNLIEFLFGMWSGEKKDFTNSKPFPQCAKTGNWLDVAHYTQIIWSKTTEVGCGIANTTASSVLVCQYKAAGNFKGNYAYTSSDLVSKGSSGSSSNSGSKTDTTTTPPTTNNGGSKDNSSSNNSNNNGGSNSSGSNNGSSKNNSSSSSNKPKNSNRRRYTRGSSSRRRDD